RDGRLQLKPSIIVTMHRSFLPTCTSMRVTSAALFRYLLNLCIVMAQQKQNKTKLAPFTFRARVMASGASNRPGPFILEPFPNLEAYLASFLHYSHQVAALAGNGGTSSYTSGMRAQIIRVFWKEAAMTKKIKLTVSEGMDQDKEFVF